MLLIKTLSNYNKREYDTAEKKKKIINGEK